MSLLLPQLHSEALQTDLCCTKNKAAPEQTVHMQLQHTQRQRYYHTAAFYWDDILSTLDDEAPDVPLPFPVQMLHWQKKRRGKWVHSERKNNLYIKAGDPLTYNVLYLFGH